jgi:hypothetical protein
MLSHGVRVPRHVDLLFRFRTTRRGFRGILLEAKSGQQDYWSAVPQLEVYRAALRAEEPGPMVVWGVTEREQGPESQLSSLDDHLAENDRWVFSSASQIGEVLRTLGLAMGETARLEQAS